MNENASLTNLMMRVNAKERLRRTEVSRRNTRERKELLDKLVGFGEMVQRLAKEDEEMRMEIERLGHQVEESIREEQLQKENRQRHSSRRVEILARRKQIAEQISQIRGHIIKTKNRLQQ